MTTHGRTGLKRLLFGSVAEAVLRIADIPVFVWRAPPTSRPWCEYPEFSTGKSYTRSKKLHGMAVVRSIIVIVAWPPASLGLL